MHFAISVIVLKDNTSSDGMSCAGNVLTWWTGAIASLSPDVPSTTARAQLSGFASPNLAVASALRYDISPPSTAHNTRTHTLMLPPLDKLCRLLIGHSCGRSLKQRPRSLPELHCNKKVARQRPKRERIGGKTATRGVVPKPREGLEAWRLESRTDEIAQCDDVERDSGAGILLPI